MGKIEVQEMFQVDATLSYEERLTFLNALERCDFQPRKKLVKAGDSAEDGLYIITKGEAVVKNEKGEIINELHEGDYFGELALLLGEGRTATVQAVTEMETVRIPKHVYDELILHNPKNQGFLFSNLYKKLSEKYNQILELTRIRETYAKICGWVFAYLVVAFLTNLITAPMQNGVAALVGLSVRLVTVLAILLATRTTFDDLGLRVKGLLPVFLISLVAVCASRLLIKLNLFDATVAIPALNGGKTLTIIGSMVSSGVSAIVFACFLPYAFSQILPRRNNMLLATLFSALLGVILPVIGLANGSLIATQYLVYALILFVANAILAFSRLKWNNGTGAILAEIVGTLIIALIL